MPTLERNFPVPQTTTQDQGRGQVDTMTAQSFLGSVLRQNPQALDKFSPRDRHVLLAHSDSVSNSSYAQLSDELGITEIWARKIFNDKIRKTWINAPAPLQEKFPLTTIFESVGQHPSLAKKLQKSVFQPRGLDASGIPIKRIFVSSPLGSIREFLKKMEDPEFRAKVLRIMEEVDSKNGSSKHSEKARSNARVRSETQGEPGRRVRVDMSPGTTNEGSKDIKAQDQTTASMGKEQKGRYSIDPVDLDLWNYVVVNQLEAAITVGFLTHSEMESLSRYFNRQQKPKNIERLLDKLSMALAQLA